MIIGDRLRALREQKNLSQGHIEKRTGLLRCYISRVENGHTVPSIETLEKLARALEVPLYQIFYEGENPPAAPQPIKSNGGLNRIEARFLMQMRRALSHTNETDRQLLLTMTRKMASRTAWILGGSIRTTGKGSTAATIRKLLVASSTTTSTPVTASPSALTSAPTAVTATTTAAFTRAGFIDYHIAAHEILAVEGLDNAGRFFIVVDFNEGEPTRLSSLAVRH
jgi:transcriptional regulator with XRE-family HTH domain